MHQDPQIELPERLQPERGRFSFALILAAGALLVVLAAMYLHPGRQSPPDGAPQNAHFAFGAAEREYAAKIQIENVTLSRAENFLHQEVTTLKGEVINDGQRSIRGLELSLEFFDEMNQIALRETRSVVVPGASPLSPGERRSFEVSFEHVPSSWNMQPPILRVTGLLF